MRLVGRRMLVLGALAAITSAALLSVASRQTNARSVRAATPLARVRLDPRLRATVEAVARRSGLDPGGIVELGASVAGTRRHAVLAGKDGAGRALLAYMTGFGLSEFVPGDRFVGADGLFVADTVEGPATEARVVGLVGIATRAVARVTARLADGAAVALPVGRAPGVPFEGFSYLSDSAATFPTQVIAYDVGGHVVAVHQVDAAPLCPADRPLCFG